MMTSLFFGVSPKDFLDTAEIWAKLIKTFEFLRNRETSQKSNLSFYDRLYKEKQKKKSVWGTG